MSSKDDLTRDETIKLTKEHGFSDDQINHSIVVADLGLKISDSMIDEGFKIDKGMVEKGALLHDIGCTRLTGELVELPEWKPYGIRFPSDDINHPTLGTVIVKDWGFSDEVVTCVLRHNIGGFTVEESKLLKIVPLPEKDLTPHSPEEKIVHYADHLALLMRLKLNPLEDPSASAKAVFPWLRYHFMNRANMDIEMGHPLVKKEASLNNELKKYVKPSWIIA